VAKTRQDLNARAFVLAERALAQHPRLTQQSRAYAHMADQMWEAVSSIGAHFEEGTAPSSRKDMAHKYSIALKESREANYWLRLIATDPKWKDEVTWLIGESSEFVAMLTVSVRNLRPPPK
jgi:four helix bundle protein